MCSVPFRCLPQDASCYSCIDHDLIALRAIRSYAEVIWKKTGRLTTGRPLHGRWQFPAKKSFGCQLHTFGHGFKCGSAHLAARSKTPDCPVSALKLIAELCVRKLRKLQVFSHDFHGFRRSERSGHALSRPLARGGGTDSDGTYGGRQSFDVNHQT